MSKPDSARTIKQLFTRSGADLPVYSYRLSTFATTAKELTVVQRNAWLVMIWKGERSGRLFLTPGTCDAGVVACCGAAYLNTKQSRRFVRQDLGRGVRA